MEGPSLLILREELAPLVGQQIKTVTGNTKQPKEQLKNRSLAAVETWGKNLFMKFTKRGAKPVYVKVHFMMFGSYRIDESKPERTPRLHLKFPNRRELFFYACSVRFEDENPMHKRDPRVDLMSPEWDPRFVQTLLRQRRTFSLCDLFLDQEVYAGSGNIVKNEVLFNLRRHPLTKLNQIPEEEWPLLSQAVYEYCWNFYEWKKKFELKKHWQVYRQSTCPLCERKLARENLGKFQRRTFYCPHDQPLKPKTKKLRLHPVLPMRKRAPIAVEAFDH